ncbi:MAG: transcription antitermination factor NusB [Candidatus Dormibacteria bacterium]
MSPGRGGGRRRRGRELAVRVLFELEGSAKDAGDCLRYQAAEVGATDDVAAFAARLVDRCLADSGAIDATLAGASSWPLAELGKVERAVLRCAVAEMLDGATPLAVVADEACELARLYAGEESVAFVNGVLSAVARERV